jgi:hypothetical protein
VPTTSKKDLSKGRKITFLAAPDVSAYLAAQRGIRETIEQAIRQSPGFLLHTYKSDQAAKKKQS